MPPVPMTPRLLFTGLFTGLLAGVLVAAGLVLTAPAAFACSCAAAGAGAHLENADVVVVATVADVRPPPWRPVMSSSDPATYELAVESVLKGRAAETTYVRSAVSGASCGIEVEQGTRYLVFADVEPGERGEELWADLCGGTAEAAPGLLDRVERLAGSADPPEPIGTDDAPGAQAPPRPLVTGWSFLAGALALLGALGVRWGRRRRR